MLKQQLFLRDVLRTQAAAESQLRNEVQYEWDPEGEQQQAEGGG